jgi:hypothetical protein
VPRNAGEEEISIISTEVPLDVAGRFSCRKIATHLYDVNRNGFTGGCLV